MSPARSSSVEQQKEIGANSESICAREEALVDQLIEEMGRARHAGRPITAEELLSRHADLRQQPAAAVRLIYEEMCLRQESGEPVSSTEVIRRFPEWETELERLFHCYRFIESGAPAPVFPSVGETIDDFVLLAELERGARGRVFVALQRSLADRPLVLKLAPTEGDEHLTLARLQHTHIVPLYLVRDLPDRHLQAICMPYLGGTTLARLLVALQDEPLAHRRGQAILNELERAGTVVPLDQPSRGPSGAFLARASYAETICWVGACLADALHYAHERGWVHLDVKPANVLIAADGQPMLLDFHLAREPIEAGSSGPHWMGGTPGYMSPEQRQAVAAMSALAPMPIDVDRRSDIYSLGLVLYEALGGDVATVTRAPSVRLDHVTGEVSRGLADIVQHCLANDPAHRYPDAGSLADDLRRHLSQLPLRGVPNRSLIERWRKWRRRRPHVLALTGMLLVSLGILATAAAIMHAQSAAQQSRRVHEIESMVRAALVQSVELLKQHRHSEAVQTASDGLTLARSIRGGSHLVGELDGQLQAARCEQEAHDLHSLVEQLRFFYSVESPALEKAQSLELPCRTNWDARDHILKLRGQVHDVQVDKQIRIDLLDLAVLWTDLLVRTAPKDQVVEKRKQALQTLTQAETLLGPNPVLERERHTLLQALGLVDPANSVGRPAVEAAPHTAWEHTMAGQYQLRSGDLKRASAEFERAVELEPQDFWSNFYRGVCAYRLRRYSEADIAFEVCVALAPRCAECYYNRALARTELHRTQEALRDYDRALQLDPNLAAAKRNRDLLVKQGRDLKKRR
jgi:serine/threonine protein kinase/Flp pilus assembly protein TadD